MAPSNFFAAVSGRIDKGASPLCLGLDPRVTADTSPLELPPLNGETGRLVDALRRTGTSKALSAFVECFRLISACADLVCCCKPNSAFFEAMGHSGFLALEAVCSLLHELGIPTILDCKRGDIGSTAEAYAQAAFDVFGADAVTCAPYIGLDGMKPFHRPGKAVFALCKTSNPGSGDFQTLELADGDPLYLRVAEQCVRQFGDAMGLVVGATDVSALRSVRRALPATWILAPGVGAQGADIQSAMEAGARADGRGIILPVSRFVSEAAEPRHALEELIRALPFA